MAVNRTSIDLTDIILKQKAKAGEEKLPYLTIMPPDETPDCPDQSFRRVFGNQTVESMTKADLVAAAAASANLTRTNTERALDAVLEIIIDTLGRSEDVRLVGFGTFSVSRRSATTGRNLRTGETIQISESNIPKFKAGKALKSAVN